MEDEASWTPTARSRKQTWQVGQDERVEGMDN